MLARMPAEASSRRRAPRASYLIGRLHRALRRALDEAVKAHGLTAAEYAALSILGDQPGLSNAQLARRSFMSAQAAHQSLIALEALGYVRRAQDPAHARIGRTELTARGRKALAACDVAVDGVEATMLRSVARARRLALIDDLRACLGALDPTYRG